MKGSSLFAQISSGDGFGFIVPNGYALYGVSYAYSSVVVGNVTAVGVLLQIAPTGSDGTFNKVLNIASWSGNNAPLIYNDGTNPSLSPVTPSPLDEPFYIVDASDNTTQDLALPLGAGLNWLIVGRFGNTSANFSATWDYSIDLDVEPTPAPPSIALFATGIGAIGFLGWRRKRVAS